MAIIWGSTNFEITYNTFLERGGAQDFLKSPEVFDVSISIPGIDGLLHQATEWGPRTFGELRAVIMGSSPADLNTKVIALENELMGSLSTETDADFISPTRALKDLQVTEVSTTKKFPNTKCIGFVVEPITQYSLASDARIKIAFKQMRPFTAAV